ncbi:hypothetical protein SPI_01583 [Niveomyces insectorum RCEF 264]|uniref:Uncharacterized protein n=1 Tax=Niveomyces insectorum RCEF 264 TaxID=1081102 RepID=A0A167Z2S4_9HYPO|nr:hypothetical protein SPI_01583 [Niveomyces insectorum RCEF 264]
MSLLLTQPLSLDDDLGAVYLARMDSRLQKKRQLDQEKPLLLSHQHQQQQQQHNDGCDIDNVDAPASPPPPPLPERNARRNSRFLDALRAPQPSPAGTVMASTATTTSTASLPAATAVVSPTRPTPHDLYLSSEEDASSLGDLSDFDDDDDVDADYDYDNDEYDADELQRFRLSPTMSVSLARMSTITTATTTTLSERSAAPPARRHSHDTARVVSVVFAGKPSLVDLAVERNARQRRRPRSFMDHHQQPPAGGALRDLSTTKHLSLSSTATSSSFSSASTASSSSSFTSSARPSTSCDTLPSPSSTAPSSRASAAAAATLHKRVHSGSMLASFRARKNGATAAAAAVQPLHVQPSQPQQQHLPAPLSSSHSVFAAASIPESTPTPPPSATTPRATSSTFGPGGLFRGVTRSLTLSRRRSRPLLSSREAAVDATAVQTAPTPTPTPTPTTTATPTQPQPQPQQTYTYNEIMQSARRKSLTLTVVASMTAMNAPPPGPPTPDPEPATAMAADGKSSSTSSRSSLALTPRSMTTPVSAPAATTVLSKKRGPSGGFLGGRRRSLRLL